LKNLERNRNQWQFKISRIFSKEIVTLFSPQVSYLSYLSYLLLFLFIFLTKSVVFS